MHARLLVHSLYCPFIAQLSQRDRALSAAQSHAAAMELRAQVFQRVFVVFRLWMLLFLPLCLVVVLVSGFGIVFVSVFDVVSCFLHSTHIEKFGCCIVHFICAFVHMAGKKPPLPFSLFLSPHLQALALRVTETSLDAEASARRRDEVARTASEHASVLDGVDMVLQQVLGVFEATQFESTQHARYEWVGVRVGE
jgi:hypothetical protein